MQSGVMREVILKPYKIFVRMLAVHCYQNDSYEITINGLQARKL